MARQYWPGRLVRAKCFISKATCRVVRLNVSIGFSPSRGKVVNVKNLFGFALIIFASMILRLTGPQASQLQALQPFRNKVSGPCSRRRHVTVAFGQIMPQLAFIRVKLRKSGRRAGDGRCVTGLAGFPRCVEKLA